MALFATATPTATPTATSTPTNTPVPPPPITVTDCVFQTDCPDASFANSYLSGPVQENILTTLEIPYNESLRLNIGWCAIDEATLSTDLQHIAYIFEIDGVSYLNLAGIKHGYTSGSDPNSQMPCAFVGAELSGWQLGQSHKVTIGYRFDAEVFDGWKTYQPFTTTYMYDFQPSNIPTATPTQTPTLTPSPTYTPSPTRTRVPLPTLPPATAAPSCEANSSISISNTTDGTVTLYLNGPANYVFYIGTGDSSVSVCAGTYNYTAYGCGGASDSGSMSSGESHQFYCQ